MDLQKLKVLIDYAIDDCQQIIQNNYRAVLSEGDFERLLSDCISNQIRYNVKTPDPDNFSVHTQISHYKNEEKEVDARVDVLLAKPKDIIQDYSYNKNFLIYTSAETVALELKYIKNSKLGLSKVKEDINKIFKYNNDSCYYSIVLMNSSKRVKMRVRNVLNYFNAVKSEFTIVNKESKEIENRFFCKVIVKE